MFDFRRLQNTGISLTFFASGFERELHSRTDTNKKMFCNTLPLRMSRNGCLLSVTVKRPLPRPEPPAMLDGGRIPLLATFGQCRNHLIGMRLRRIPGRVALVSSTSCSLHYDCPWGYLIFRPGATSSSLYWPVPSRLFETAITQSHLPQDVDCA